MESEVNFVTDEKRLRPKNSEVFRLYCDNTKIKKITGYKPKISIQDGLQRTISWFTEPKNLRHYKAEIYNV